MYYRARYYDSSIGRFVSSDPDPGKLASPLSFVNKFIYAGNNPINNVDPFGLFKIKITIGGDVGSAFKSIGRSISDVGREAGRFWEKNKSEIIAVATVGATIASAGAFGVAAGAIMTSAAIGAGWLVLDLP